MPRYRPTRPRKVYDRNEFVNLLAGELTVDVSGPARQPLIYEEPIDQTDTIHIVVYWDRWAEVPSEERSGIILDAYERVDRSLVPKVTFAMGVTFDEAAELNLLPWAVVPVNRRNEADPREVEAAMLEEGAIRRTDGLHLLFPTEELADSALERLSARVPKVNWALSQTLSPMVPIED